MCPLCNSLIEIDIAWAKKNGRVFCGTCCKSFDVIIKQEPEPEPEPEKSTIPPVPEKLCDVFGCDGCNKNSDPYGVDHDKRCSHCKEKHEEDHSEFLMQVNEDFFE